MARTVAAIAFVLGALGGACSSPSPMAPTDFVAGGERPVPVHVPAGVDPAGAPLLLVLHGFTSNGAEMESWLPLGAAADRRGVVWAYPEGTANERGERFWNATDACCGFGSDVDDSAYLAALIDEIATKTPIDRRRVYIVGHSNGGFMSHRMACDHADKVAAIAPISGVTFADPADCRPSAPVALLQVHGDADDTIRFDGGALGGSGTDVRPYPGVVETVDTWLALDGCDQVLTEISRRLDVDAEVAGPDGLAETTVAESTGCDPGSRVELWTMEGVGHVPMLSETFPDALLDFLLAQSRP
jgi:polyhydroxybutyrate depolymerase